MTSMHVIEVIPFSKGAPPGSLSYRHKDALPAGTLVEVPLRKKRVRGVVTGSTDVLEAKASLKRADFILSGSVEEIGTLPGELVAAARQAALYHAAPLGAVLAQLLESADPDALPAHLFPGSSYGLETVEAPYQARMARYRTRIGDALAEEKAVLLVVPTLAECARFKEALKDLSPLVLSGALPAKRREAALARAAAHKGLVIATPAFAFVAMERLGLVILERASAGGYRLPKRPYLDMVRALMILCEVRLLPFALGDYPLPMEYRSRPDAALSGTESLGPLSVLDAKAEEEKQGATYKAVPDPLRKELARVLAEGGRAAVLAVRRGFSPAVVCRDCGNAVRDSRGHSLSLATVKGGRALRSSDGTILRDADAVCDVCGSWNLLPLGAGVERVHEELQEAFPGATLVRFDTDAVRTPAQARSAAKLLSEPGTIAVGTEFLLPWLDPERPLDFACIASADTLLALPFWRSRERFVRLALTLRERAGRVTVATRRMDDAAVRAAEDPCDPAFFEEEAMLRKALGYPPFSTLIAVRAEGAPQWLSKAGEAVRSAFAGRAVAERTHQNARTWIASLPQGSWPDPELSSRLAALPLPARVLIDPDSLL